MGGALKLFIFKNYYNNKNDNKQPNIDFISIENVLYDEKYSLFINTFYKEKKIQKSINNIGIARTILQIELFNRYDKNNLFWIIDDDMEFGYENKIIELFEVIQKNQNSIDILVGSYENEPPVPFLSTLRCSLIDFLFSKRKFTNVNFNGNFNDYYYDLTDENNCHLETPFYTEAKKLNQIFNREIITRKIKNHNLNNNFPKNRGGNTIIFNKNALKVPVFPLRICDKFSRRADYLWLLECRKMKFKIKSSTFSIKHNRGEQLFNFKNELNKLIDDLIGSSFTKAFKLFINDGEIKNQFKIELIRRYSKFVVNYYRISGILKILNNKIYIKYFNDSKIKEINHEIENILSDENLIQYSIKNYKNKVSMFKNWVKFPKIERKISKIIGSKLKMLGFGNEGVVFESQNKIYKVFYYKFNWGHINKMYHFIKDIKYFYQIEFCKNNGLYYIQYNKSLTEDYSGNFANQFVDLITELKKRNVCIKNIKKSNFVLDKNEQIIKYIDFGESIVPYNDDLYWMSKDRAYQLIKYHFLEEYYFNYLTFLWYKNERTFLHGKELLYEIFENKISKEEIHDKKILNLIKKTNPQSILDYGAGKCKILNSLDSKIKKYAFDIDLEMLKNRANKNIKIIENFDDFNIKVDIVISNLVGCVINNSELEILLKNVGKNLVDNGKFIFSICNPYFDGNKSLKENENLYTNLYKFRKVTKFINRYEYHRPVEYYKNLLKIYGFGIVEIIMEDGINIDNLNHFSEWIYFICEKQNLIEMNDCALLIKCNSSEYKNIYRNVIDIVENIEKGIKFSKKIILLDIEKSRSRKFSNNNRKLVKQKLFLLKQLGYIDLILEPKIKELKNINKVYFDLDVNTVSSKNGQSVSTFLYALDQVKENYVFQTDSDILYINKDNDEFYNMFLNFKKSSMISAAPSIVTKRKNNLLNDTIEVRCSFINLKILKNLLPLNNFVNDANLFEFSWHKSISISNYLPNLRFSSNKFMFIHPDNELKKSPYYINLCKNIIQKGIILNEMFDNVNLIENISLDNFLKKTVIFIRGRNTKLSKTLELLNSLKRQSFQDFSIVYFDDDSDILFDSFQRTIFEFDNYFKNKIFYIKNDWNINSLQTTINFITKIIKNNHLIINIDSDDYLMNDDALKIIIDKFEKNNCDLTVGNIFRFDKPWKNYSIKSFYLISERSGDNIWLHPKCFYSNLFWWSLNRLERNISKYKNCFDYAMLIPIINHCKNPMFIKEKIYFFEPSLNGQLNKNKLINKKNKKSILKESQMIDSRKIVAVIGDSNINEDDENYKIAEELGKLLVDNKYRIQTGGYGGIMEAVFKGAKKSKNYIKETNIAIIPSNNPNDANEYSDVIIPTGLDIMRNAKVIDCDAVISIGGGAGTLSELAMAWQKFKLIIAYKNSGGWSSELANKRIDPRVRYKYIPDDKVYGVDSTKEALDVLNKYINKYNRKYNNIQWRREKVNVDLHCHIDGDNWNIEAQKILNNSLENKIKLISIIDKDNLNNQLEYKKIFEEKGIKYLIGFETNCEINDKDFISKNANNKLCILGLDLNLNLKNAIQEINKKLDRYKKLNIDIEKKKINYLTKHYNVVEKIDSSKTLFEILYRKKIIKNKEEFDLLYNSIFIKNKFREKFISSKEIINIIHKFNGKAILANPYIKESGNLMSDEEVKKNVNQLIKEGIDGIEIFNTKKQNNVEKTNFLLKIAIKHKLLISIGSGSNSLEKPNWLSRELNKHKKIKILGEYEWK